MIILKPYDGAGPIAFGMNVEEITASIGNPKLSTKNRRGETLLIYENIHITLSDKGVVEIELLPVSDVYFDEIAIFSDPHALQKLCVLDGNPKELVGAVILMKLGISITGLSNQEGEQKSVSVFARGRFDILKSQMEPLSNSA